MSSNWATLTPENVARTLSTDLKSGLSPDEAKRRLARHGPNKLPEKGGPAAWKMLLEQFTDFMVIVLIAATIISWVLGEHGDALAILAIVVLNAILGFVQEYRAEKSLAALKELSAPSSRVLRGGAVTVVPSSEVVPGDIILLESGDRISADGRITWAGEFDVDEAALTGESLPVPKDAAPLTGRARSLGDLRNMVFSGTLVTRGRGRAVVVSTGTETELGKIAGMIEEAEAGDTPLQKRLAQLGRWLVCACGIICALVGVIGVIRGEPVRIMFLTAVSLAVAAIPEGLPAIVTIALAIGVQRMIRRRAIIRRLPAVETLGCATVICSDKTGTLTENEMTVVRVYTGGHEYRVTGAGYRPRGEFMLGESGPATDPRSDSILMLLLKTGVLCNNASLIRQDKAGRDATWRLVGDPTEGALLAVGAKAGLGRAELENSYRLESEYPFESERRRMSIVCRGSDGSRVVFAKGAPEAILSMCDRVAETGGTMELGEARRAVLTGKAEAMARQALRVLALAYRPVRSDEGMNLKAGDAERDLVFLGMVGMHDPPRPQAVHAIATCRKAGIMPVMITGDHPETAQAVAREIGLLDGKRDMITGLDLEAMSQAELERVAEKKAVYARVSPHHKLRIVRALKKRGHVVAMTGDGVNDAPAVKEADIGVAMGISGTEVTKEAAAMVVTDDNFASIIAAVEEGRAIYDNIRKFIRYLLGCNTGEVLTAFIAAVSGMPMPLLPIQILWTNLVTDGLPALALGVEGPEPDIMERPPRAPSEGVFARGLARGVLTKGMIIGLCTVGIFLLALATGTLERARTMAFCTLVLSQLVFAFQCRSERHGLFEAGIAGNPYLVSAVGISLAMQLAVVGIRALHPVFGTTALTIGDWGLVVLFSSWTVVIAETYGALRRMIKRRFASFRA